MTSHKRKLPGRNDPDAAVALFSARMAEPDGVSPDLARVLLGLQDDPSKLMARLNELYDSAPELARVAEVSSAQAAQKAGRMADNHPSPASLDSPGDDAATVTPHDTTALAVIPRALWVGSGGHVKVTTRKGTAVVFKNVPTGSYLMQRVTHVWSTGTTASDILAVE